MTQKVKSSSNWKVGGSIPGLQLVEVSVVEARLLEREVERAQERSAR